MSSSAAHLLPVAITVSPRVRLADVLAYRERIRRRRAAGLDRMVAAAEDAGLYDLPDMPFERLPVEDTEE